MRYAIYDAIDPTRPDLTFEERLEIVANFAFPAGVVQVVQTDQVNDLDELMSFHQGSISAGFEGTMIRDGIAVAGLPFLGCICGRILSNNKLAC